MTKSFNTLREKLSPAAKKKASKKTAQLIAAMPLQKLRQSRQISQEHLATSLATKQANISRLERRADMYISTLRHYIHAMGGELKIIAHFPEGDICIDQFSGQNATTPV